MHNVCSKSSLHEQCSKPNGKTGPMEASHFRGEGRTPVGNFRSGEKRKVFQINTCPPSHYQFNHIWFLLQNCFFCLFLLVDLLNKNTSLNTQELNVPRRALLLSKNFAQGAIYSSAALIALTRAIILSSVSDRQNQTMTQTSLSHWQVSTYQFRLDPSELSLSVLCLPWKGDFSTFFLESYVFLSRSKRLCISFSPTTVIIR